MPDDAKFNEEEMLHLFSAMMGATEKEEKEAIAEAKAAPSPTPPAAAEAAKQVPVPPAPLPAPSEAPPVADTPMAAPSEAPSQGHTPMAWPLPAKPEQPPAPASPPRPVQPPEPPPLKVKLPESALIPPPPPPVTVEFDPSQMAVEEPEPPPPPPPPPPSKPSREQLKHVEELGHQFEIGRQRVRQLLIPFIGERVAKKMLAWSLERVQKTHPIFKNVHWSSQGELHDDGTIEVDRLVKNAQAVQGQDVVVLTKAAMLELLAARLAAVEQGLGVSLRQAVEKEVRRLEELLG